ncbi:hypothetical protein [Vibrio sp. HN007]|uniref:hypothetical protein n=1 Tax=Vibrio iocasae TaxID=3098914 RepID=UPI0035D440A4
MQSRFSTLNTLLLNHQEYWRIEPFKLSAGSDMPWHISNPQLTEWLDTLSFEDIAHYKANTCNLVEEISQHLPATRDMHSLIALPEESAELKLARGLDTGIPGRKLTQITSMGACSLEHHVGNEWLEWCSGVF